MIEIFDQVKKDRKQIFKKPEGPSDELLTLGEIVEKHLDWHIKMKQRWKMAGIVAAITITALTILIGSGFIFASYMSKGTP